MTLGTWDNVSGAVLMGAVIRGVGSPGAGVPSGSEGDSILAAKRLAGVFAETFRVGDDLAAAGPGRVVPVLAGAPCVLREITAALAAATTERVLVLGSGAFDPSLDLILALSAWPEADAVLPAGLEDGDSLCAIYRRESALSVARTQLESGAVSLVGFHTALSAERVSFEALGLADVWAERFAATAAGGMRPRSRAG